MKKYLLLYCFRRSLLLSALQDGEQQNYSWTDACVYGHLSLVQYYHQNHLEGCTSDAMDMAAEYGNLDVVEFLHNHRDEGCTEYAMEEAIVNGHANVVRWLYHNREERCLALDYALRHYDDLDLNVDCWLYPDYDDNGFAVVTKAYQEVEDWLCGFAL